MKRLLVRFIVYVLTFVVFVGGVGSLGLIRSQKDFYGASSGGAYSFFVRCEDIRI